MMMSITVPGLKGRRLFAVADGPALGLRCVKARRGRKSRSDRNCRLERCGSRPQDGRDGQKGGCAQCAHPGLRIGSYWCRTGPDSVCFGGRPVFAGAGTRFESHLGHVFSLFRGLLASECAQTVHLWAPSGAFLLPGRYCGRRLLLVVSGSGGAAYSFMARGAASCMTGRWLGERCCRCWFAFLDGMTVHGDVAR